MRDDGSRPRVLVIDDDAMVARSVSRCLRHCEVTVTERATDALQQLASGTRYDAIICDLMMPEMTGMDLYDEVLRVAPEEADRMIFITAAATTARAREFVARVPNPVLAKPFDVRALREHVARRIS